MPAELKRKVIKHGNSVVITIPKSYTRYFKLKPGDEVKVLFDSLLLIVPKSGKKVVDEKKELIDKLLTS